MSKYWYEVDGAGGMGIPTVFDLFKNSEAYMVLLNDPNEKQLTMAKERLDQLLGSQRKYVLYSSDPNDRFRGKETDVVISCAPHAANVEIAQKAMNDGIPYCDLGGSHNVASVQKSRAYGLETPVVVGCGVAPGTVMIAAAHFAAQGCKKVMIYCGGLPYPKPDPKGNPLMYKCTWSMEGLAHEYCGKSLVIRGGEQEVRSREVRALSNVGAFTLTNGPAVEEFETIWTSNNSYYCIEYLRELGVHKFDYRTLRYPGHTAVLEKNVPKKNGLFIESEMLTFLKSRNELVFDRAVDFDRMITVVLGAPERDAEWTHELRLSEVYKDTITGFTAMEIMTSLGASIVAHALAQGRCSAQGFATPEMCVDRPWYLAELKRRLALYNMHY